MNCSYQKKKGRDLLKKLWSVLATLSRLEFRILTELELLEKWELWTALHGGDGSASAGSSVELTQLNCNFKRPTAVKGLETLEEDKVNKRTTATWLYKSWTNRKIPISRFFIIISEKLINGRLDQTCE